MNKKTPCASALLMIRPASFGYNAQTASTNIYQQQPASTDTALIQEKALQEFDDFVKKLNDAGLKIIVFDDTPTPTKPDAIFPNNWLSLHHDGTLVLYPMYAKNRRTERRNDIIETLKNHYGFQVKNRIDLTGFELQEKFLEGTGSLVFDHENRIAFAAVSQRTAPELVIELCKQINYAPFLFHAISNKIPVYHTNVMLSVCKRLVIVCFDYFTSEKEKQKFSALVNSTGKEIIAISPVQASAFAGNVLETVNEKNEHLLIMSSAAFKSFDSQQIKRIEKHCRIVHSPLQTIEKFGGGSARCMLAEIFLP